MASSGVITISGSITSLPQGAWTVGPYTLLPNSSGNYVQTEVTLASGSNTILVPSWAAGCIVVPPPTNTQTLTASAVAISETEPSLFSFTTAPANIVMVAGGLTTAPTNFIFF